MPEKKCLKGVLLDPIGQSGTPFVIHIQFLAQVPRQSETTDNAVDRPVLGNLVLNTSWADSTTVTLPDLSGESIPAGSVELAPGSCAFFVL